MQVFDSKFSFLQRYDGPGGRSEPRCYIGPGRKQPRVRTPDAGTAFMMSKTRSLPLIQHGVPAGFSGNLGNRLPAETYANLSCIYDAERTRGSRQRKENLLGETRRKVPEHISRVGWEQPEEELPHIARRPAGDVPIRKVGKRMIEENANMMSNCDTCIWGRDLDGSAGQHQLSNTDVYASSAGHVPRGERNPPYGVAPPVCKRTFGPEPPHEIWESVKYERPANHEEDGPGKKKH